MRPRLFVEVGELTSSGVALTYAAGGGATIRFLRGALEVWEFVLGTLVRGVPISGVAGSGVFLTAPDRDRFAVVA